MEAVDILFRSDAPEDCEFVDLFGQGRLDEDTVHVMIGVQPVDQRNKFGLADGNGGKDDPTGNSDFCRGLFLFANVRNGGRILTDAHKRKTGLAS